MCSLRLPFTSHHTCFVTFFLFQFVVPPVEMEEHVLSHLPLLTASVPVGTREHTVRKEVHIPTHNHVTVGP